MNFNRRSFVLVGALLAGSAATGCAPAWHVVAFASPNPFVGQHKFAVAPIDYAGLMIGRKPEPVYLSEKDPKQQASFQEDKAALNEKFLERLIATAREHGIEVVPATGPESAPFILKPHVDFIEPGFYAAVARAPSEVHMALRIVGPDNHVLDEISLAHGTDPGSGVSIGGISIPKDPSSGGRLRTDGAHLGELVGKYLTVRTGAGG
jgi:hypothetical protein